MKKSKLQLMFTGLFLVSAAGSVFAQEKSREEKKVESRAAELDKSAEQSEGQQRVLDRIKSEFAVDDARVQALREKNTGYGEISIELSLAQALPGGITDANVEKVTALRRGPPVMGWGNVAKTLGLKLGPVISKVKKISAEVRKREKAAKAEKKKKAKAEKNRKNEKAYKPEKREKSEKMGSHGNSGKR